jgi:glycosyltransferase involved in cell wall biosynthesis
MMLARIASELAAAGVEFHFDIIGDGPDRDRLGDAFAQAHLNAQVTFRGYLPRQETLPVLQRAHLFVLPSRYEGHSWALLETMASGCVPVVSRIVGGTDFVVEHGVNGVLCTVGSAQAFSKEIVNLSADRKRLEILSAAASGTIRDRFSLDRVVRDHDTLFQTVLGEAPIAYTPVPVSEIQMPGMSGSKWRRFVPQGVKNYVRTWAERFQRSV